MIVDPVGHAHTEDLHMTERIWRVPHPCEFLQGWGFWVVESRVFCGACYVMNLNPHPLKIPKGGAPG